MGGAETPSINGEWEQIEALLGRMEQRQATNRKVKCWVLAADDCVVGFREESWLASMQKGEHVMVKITVVLCGMLAVFLTAYAGMLHMKEPPGGYHMPLPTHDPDSEDVPLSARVRQVLDVTGKHYADATPSASGESTLRTSADRGDHRTIEVMLPGGELATVPRNLAA